MLSYVLQGLLIVILIAVSVEPKKPPGYVAPQKEYDPHPPKYQYGYKIQDNKSVQGKDEERDGIYAQGRYYVDKGPESNQSVKYFADDWGFHPVVEYSNTSPHSRSSANFVLGHEAIKLKNNQKSIPTDPNDPGRAQNLVDPSKIAPPQVVTTTSFQPQSGSSPQILVQPQSPVPTPTVALQLIPTAQPATVSSQPRVFDQNPNNQLLIPAVQSVVDPSKIAPQVVPTVGLQPQLASSRQILLTSSQIPVAQPTTPTILQQTQQQLIYYVRHPQNGLLLQNVNVPIQETALPLLQQQQLLPQPQALILPQNNAFAPSSGGPSNLYVTGNPQLSTPRSNSIDNVTPTVVNVQPTLPVVTSTEPNIKKLIDTTRNLVTGDDVLKINGAIPNRDVEIDSNILEPLLNKYVTPIVATTTIRPIESTTSLPTAASLLKEPIVAAETIDEDIEDKPVTEKTEENRESFSSTARTFLLSTSTTSSPTEVVVTPRPVSSKFLAPITAGIQLQTIEEENNKAGEDGEEEEEEEGEKLEKQKVLVQVQKTVPYYLGMYQYPENGRQDNPNEIQKVEQRLEEKVAEDLELGKSLLYTPGEDKPARAEQLVLFSPNRQQQQLADIATNHLSSRNDQQIVTDNQSYQTSLQQIEIEKTTKNNQQTIIHQPYTVQVPVAVPYPVIKQVPVAVEKVVEKPVHITQVLEKPVPYPQPFPVEKIIDRPVHVPIEITKYIDRLYPVEVPVPYPQHYPVEKVVEKVVRQPYPVEIRVPVPVPHPVPVVERKVQVPYRSSPQAYLVQIPGIFSQQKYSNLVHQQPQNLYKQLEQEKNEDQRFVTNYLYAPRADHYRNQQTLHQQSLLMNNGGRLLPSKYKKLNLFIVPGNNANHYPLDLQAGETYRYSKAKLNNGYLPPLADHKKCQDEEPEAAASVSDKSYTAIRLNNDNNNNIGLTPPKFDHSKNIYRSGRSSFDEKSIRMEYGFKPPLIPSIEIDEQGRPIGKNGK